MRDPSRVLRPPEGLGPFDSLTFSVVLGGPLFRLLCRTHLSDDALRLLRRRIVVLAGSAWVPLLMLAALDGNLLGKHLEVPFLFDLETHVRFLVVVPLLIGAELLVHQRLLPVARMFLQRNLIPADGMSRFDAAVHSASRLRNSMLAELLLLVFVYAVGILIVWRRYAIVDIDTWYVAGAGNLTKAGVWYAFVSLPLFQFLLIRWYYRLLIWARFLWQVSRIPLQLMPAHPDQLGGLGFLSNTVYAFLIVLVAHGALLAAQIANRVFFLGVSVLQFKYEIAAVLLFLLLMILGPLLVFVPQLAQAKRTGLRDYGLLAERYVRQFDRKWLDGEAPEEEPLVGTADIQSLADMNNSFATVRAMNLVPITRNAILQLAGAVLIPMLPLLLTLMPMEQLVSKLLGLVF